MDSKIVPDFRATARADTKASAHREQPAPLPPGSYVLDLDAAEKLVVGSGLRLRCRACGCRIGVSASPRERKTCLDSVLAHWRLHAPDRVEKFLDFARRHPIAFLDAFATLLVEEHGPELLRGAAITRIRGES